MGRPIVEWRVSLTADKVIRTVMASTADTAHHVALKQYEDETGERPRQTGAVIQRA